jgi:hypothetical protein
VLTNTDSPCLTRALSLEIGIGVDSAFERLNSAGKVISITDKYKWIDFDCVQPLSSQVRYTTYSTRGVCLQGFYAMEDKMNDKSRESTSSSTYEPEEHTSSRSGRTIGPITGGDEEKAIGLDGDEYPTVRGEENGTFEKARSQSRRSQDRRSLRSTKSHQSRAGGDGYTCFDAEPANTRPNNSKPGTVTEQPYLVTWDGDSDPENPRSMSKLRRWIIVLICSASSLCV